MFSRVIRTIPRRHVKGLLIRCPSQSIARPMSTLPAPKPKSPYNSEFSFNHPDPTSFVTKLIYLAFGVFAFLKLGKFELLLRFRRGFLELYDLLEFLDDVAPKNPEEIANDFKKLTLFFRLFFLVGDIQQDFGPFIDALRKYDEDAFSKIMLASLEETRAILRLRRSDFSPQDKFDLVLKLYEDVWKTFMKRVFARLEDILRRELAQKRKAYRKEALSLESDSSRYNSIG